MTPGRSRSHYEGGAVYDTDDDDDTKHFCFNAGEHMLHDLEDIGDTVLTFVTAQSRDGENAPMTLYQQS